MKTSVTGLNVRFFNVKIATGRAFALAPKSIGRVLTRATYVGRHRFDTKFWKTRAAE
ncbi:MAG TPA: hypothetical protein VIY51_23725 [Xanthobacteraceae bacterium]